MAELTEKQKQVIRDYAKWYEKEWAKCVGLEQVPESLKKAVENFQYRFSSIWRHECLFNMRYFAQIRKTEYDAVVFTVLRRSSDVVFKTNYAYAYIYEQPEYVCMAGTFKSMDGEYRYRWITYEQFKRAYEKRPDLHKVYQYLNTLIESGEIALSLHVCPAVMDAKRVEKITKLVTRLDLARMLFTAVWCQDMDRLRRQRLENHLTPGYPLAMFSKNDLTFELPAMNYLEFFRYYKSATQVTPVLALGQKITPLTVKEVENSTDIQYGPWRELYAANLVSDLVINGIGSMFPLLNDWFFILNGDEELYDNAVHHQRLDHSETASEIVKDLEQVRRKTYKPDPVMSKELYLSLRMEELSDAIEVPVDYAEAVIILSPITLVSLTEHVGITYGDLVKDMKDEVSTLTRGPIFTDYNTFSRYLFDLIYGVWCLNSRLGIIHTDLHLNNITTFYKVGIYSPLKKEYLVKDAKIVYQVQGVCYVFPNYGVYSAIIDYSRCVFSKHHVKQNFPGHQVQDILGDQKKRILVTLARDLPELYNRHLKDLEAALMLSYDQVFRIFQAIDCYKLAIGWLALVRDARAAKLTTPEVVEKATAMLESIRDQALGFLTADLPKTWSEKVREEDLPQPTLEILKNHFKPWIMEEFTGTLTDYANDQNPITYNTRDKLPPTMSLDYIKKHKVPGEINAVTRYEDYLPYLKDHPPEEEVREVAEKVKATKYERRGLPEELDPTKTPKPKRTSKIDIQISEDYYET